MKSEVLNIAAMLAVAAQRLADTLGLPARTARLEARVLAGQVLKVETAWLIAHDTDSVSDHQHAAFDALLNRRLAGEPIAYLTGQREFYGHSFLVTPDVLIPRPETELLVERALAHIPLNKRVDVLELGCGSGCVAISIALARPDARITAVDSSVAALAVAKKNAARHNVHIELVNSDWFAGLKHRKFDLIVSNPPYVASQDAHLAQGDVRFEPLVALASGPEGTDALRSIISTARRHLHTPSHIFIEHGNLQGLSVQHFLHDAGFKHLPTWKDLAGNDRVSGGIASE